MYYLGIHHDSKNKMVNARVFPSPSRLQGHGYLGLNLDSIRFSGLGSALEPPISTVLNRLHIPD